MNFKILEKEFFAYLQENDKLKGWKSTEEKAKDVLPQNIFLYETEFKKYLVSEYGADASIFTKSLSEISEADIENGKLTEDDEKLFLMFEKDENDIPDNNSFTGENNVSGNNGSENIEYNRSATDFLNEKGIKYDSVDEIENFFTDERISGIFASRDDGNLTLDDKINALNLINTLDNDETKVSKEDITSFVNYVNTFYGDGNTEFNKDINEKILSDMKNYDGTNFGLSLKGLLSSSKTEETENIEEETEQSNEDTEIDESAIIEANKISSKNTHAGNYTGVGTTLASTTQTNDIKAVEEQIKAKNDEIKKQNEIKAEALSSNGIYKNYINSLNSANANILEYKSNLTEYKSQLHNTEYDLIATKEELNNLKDPVVFTEYTEEINSLKTELQTKIETLTKQKDELVKKISETENALKEEESNKKTVNLQISEYEKNNPSDIIEQCNNNIKTLQGDIKTLEKEKAEKETELDEKRKEELSDAKVFGKASAYRQSEFTKFMLDYATNPDTKKYYDDWYFREWNGHSYCAIFTSNVTELMYAKVMDKLGLTKADLRNLDGYGQLNNGQQGINGDQMGMHAIQWGNEIQPALDALGINMKATIDITKLTAEERKNAVKNGLIYPGMTFEYKDNNGGYHTGFVESINKDMTWTTIEGNIDVRYEDNVYERHTVGSRTVDTSKKNLSAMTDSTAKALIWAYQKGLLSIDEINSMTYARIFTS